VGIVATNVLHLSVSGILSCVLAPMHLRGDTLAVSSVSPPAGQPAGHDSEDPPDSAPNAGALGAAGEDR
jgi:hypothetical protein